MKCPDCGFEWGRSGSRTIPAALAQKGCVLTAENIKYFGQNALLFWFLNHSGPACRVSYILTLLGIDEAGKVLKILKGSIEAEAKKHQTVKVDNWFHHWAKGPEASEMALLIIEWLMGIAENEPFMVDGNGRLKDDQLFADWRHHLRVLSKDFSSERNSMIYVDYNEGSHRWHKFNSPRNAIILMDAVLLLLFADIVINHFKGGGSFLDLSAKMQSVRDSPNLDDALSEIDTISGFNLRDIFREIRDSTETEDEDCL